MSSLRPIFKAVQPFFRPKLGTGESFRFWADEWSGNERLSQSFPRLFALALDLEGSVRQAWQNTWARPYHRHYLISECLILCSYRSYWLISDPPRARTRGYGAARILIFEQSFFDFENKWFWKTRYSCNSGVGCGKAVFR